MELKKAALSLAHQRIITDIRKAITRKVIAKYRFVYIDHEKQKDNLMRLKYIVFALSLSSCGSAPHTITDRDDFLAEATRRYKGEDRERVIRAAETVIKHSDPADVEIRYTASGFTALRKYFIYAVFASASGREKWEFTVEDAPGAKVASISISEAGTSTGGYAATPYENTMNAFPLYRLFWKRVDYMLGLRPDWAYCTHEETAVRAAGQSPASALSGLCGPTSEGRDAPPPQPFAPATATPATRAPALAGR
ncbi:hypothetical protein [Methylocystis parvus]|uniref:hypothetical protein n=1 Tax=Methylocystis parvus TaxID=134 RepID=UPI003C718635